MYRLLLHTLTAAALAPALLASDRTPTTQWSLGLGPLTEYTPTQELYPDPTILLPNFSTHTHSRLLVASRTWSDDGLDDALGSGLAVGYERDYRFGDSGLGWEVGVLGFYENESESVSGVGSAELDLLLIEFLFGGRYTQRVGASNFYLYAAGGADGAFSYTDASASGAGLSFSDSSTDFVIGGYARLGGYYQLPGSFVVGLDARQTFGLEVEDVDADYFQIGVTLGWGR